MSDVEREPFSYEVVMPRYNEEHLAVLNALAAGLGWKVKPARSAFDDEQIPLQPWQREDDVLLDRLEFRGIASGFGATQAHSGRVWNTLAEYAHRDPREQALGEIYSYRGAGRPQYYYGARTDLQASMMGLHKVIEQGLSARIMSSSTWQNNLLRSIINHVSQPDFSIDSVRSSVE